MSHESVEPGRRVVYTLPGQFSDVLRTREFGQFFDQYEDACFSVRTLDGWSWTSSGSIPQFTATFRRREALDSVLDDASESRLGRLFLEGSVELEGNFLVLLSVAQYTLRHSEGLSRGLVQTLVRLTHDFSKRLIPTHRSSGNRNWHFAPCPLDLPVSFYEPWLGSFLGHSFSCFDDGEEEFESAQRRAFEQACVLLELEPGDRLLDFGCGWGSLLIHAAESHGVWARGIASSDVQLIAAAERLHCRSLHRQCSVERRDLRSMHRPSPEFDKISHLGIFEQVSNSDFPEYLKCLRSLLVPGGLLLLHRITSSPETGACITLLPSDFLVDGISRELQLAEKAGFDLIGVESLQSEYQESLRIWIKYLLNTDRSAATRLFSSGYRAWMLYLIEVATCLNTGEAQVYRLLLRRRA